MTLRNALIATHDALVTACALFVSFYLRFEGERSVDRLPLLLRSCRTFVAFSVVVCYVFKLTTTKWRFISLPDALNILRVVDGAGAGAAGARLYLRRAERLRHVLPRQDHDRPLLVSCRCSFWARSRFAYRYFRYTRVRRHAKCATTRSATLLIGRAADAEVLLRGIESGAVKRIWPVGLLSPSPADRGQTIRGIPVLGGIDDLEDVIARLRTSAASRSCAWS